jgi:hypothetical protein
VLNEFVIWSILQTEVSTLNTNICPQLAAVRHDLHVSNPDEPTCNECQQNGSDSSNFLSMKMNKLSGAMPRNHTMDEDGKVFYVLLGGAIRNAIHLPNVSNIPGRFKDIGVEAVIISELKPYTSNHSQNQRRGCPRQARA